MSEMSQSTEPLRAESVQQIPISAAERSTAEQQINLDTDFATAGFDRSSLEQRVVGAVAEKITAEIKKPNFGIAALSFLGKILWNGLNTKVGKVLGGVALGFFALRFGSIIGQSLAGGILGAAIAAGGLTNITKSPVKLNPYHVAIGSLVGITAVAVTAPLFLGVVGWSVAAAALPAAILIAGKKKLWVPEAGQKTGD